MKRHLVLAIAVAALGLAAVNLFSFRGEGTASDREEEGSAVWLSKLKNRVDQLEARLKDASARLDGLSSLPASYESPKGPEGGDEAAAEQAGEIAGLRSQMSALAYRVQALEEDPVNRGYTFLNSESAQLRLEGINSLRRLARFDLAAREAIRNMLRDPSGRVREEAADAVGDLGDREAAPLLAQMLGDPDGSVREEAVDSLGKLGATEASASIVQMLGDPDADVREEAIVALGKFGATEAGASIAQMLGDPQADVRQEAADVLGRLRAREGTDALIQALNDSDGDVRGEAIASLGEVGAVEAVPYLRDMYERNPGRDVIRLVTALRALGDEEPFQQEVQRFSGVALSSDDARARGQAVQMLSRFAREEAQDVFTQALQDPSDRVRREAERALRRRN